MRAVEAVLTRAEGRGESWTYTHWGPGGFVREDFTGVMAWALGVGAPGRVVGP